jgi:transcriptional regulator with XRE-family HTH domain
MAAELQVILAENLRRLRSEHGLSQEAFALRSGIHRTYIGGIERGERNVTLDTVARIAAAFGVDPADLLREPAPSTA